eukprot:44277-Eustigmatos_ZCMA.PRE.1
MLCDLVPLSCCDVRAMHICFSWHGSIPLLCFRACRGIKPRRPSTLSERLQERCGMVGSSGDGGCVHYG